MADETKGETQLDRIENRVEFISEILTGDGTPEKGHIVRIDRLERVQKCIIWVAGIAVSSVIIAGIGLLVANSAS